MSSSSSSRRRRHSDFSSDDGHHHRAFSRSYYDPSRRSRRDSEERDRNSSSLHYSRHSSSRPPSERDAGRHSSRREREEERGSRSSRSGRQERRNDEGSERRTEGKSGKRRDERSQGRSERRSVAPDERHGGYDRGNDTDKSERGSRGRRQSESDSRSPSREKRRRQRRKDREAERERYSSSRGRDERDRRRHDRLSGSDSGSDGERETKRRRRSAEKSEAREEKVQRGLEKCKSLENKPREKTDKGAEEERKTRLERFKQLAKETSPNGEKDLKTSSPAKERSASPSISSKKIERPEQEAAEAATQGPTSQTSKEGSKISRLERFKALQQLKPTSGSPPSLLAPQASTSDSRATVFSAEKEKHGASEKPAGTTSFQAPSSKVSLAPSGDKRDTPQPRLRRLGDSAAVQAAKAAASAAATAVATLAAQTLSASRGGREAGEKNKVEEAREGSEKKPAGWGESRETSGDAGQKPSAPLGANIDVIYGGERLRKTVKAGGEAVAPGGRDKGAVEDREGREETKGDDGDVETQETQEAQETEGVEDEQGRQGNGSKKKMSKAKERKQRQQFLLRTIAMKTQSENTADDPLDAFMTALESEAKEELDAAKEEERGRVAQLRCLNTKGKKEAAKPKKEAASTVDASRSISLEEISRWAEVEHQFIPVKAEREKPSGERDSSSSLVKEEQTPSDDASSPSKPASLPSGSSEGASSAPHAQTLETGETSREETRSLEKPEASANLAAVDERGEGMETDPSRLRVKSEPADAAPSDSASWAPPARDGPRDTVETAAETHADAAAEAAAAVAAGGAGEEGAKDEDDAYYRVFMEEMKKKKEEAQRLEEEREKRLKMTRAVIAGEVGRGPREKKKRRRVEEEEDERVFSDGEEEDSSEEEGEGKDPGAQGDEENLSYFDLLMKVGAKKQLPTVDHEASAYPPIKKNLYIQVKEITCMKDHEVDALRKTHGNIKVRGKQCPRPITTFFQCGLPDKIVKYLTLRGITEPFPIQMQAIPCLMCGRDVIAVAETGSGKTLAYGLPLIRHVLSVKQQYKTYLANKKLEVETAEEEGEKKPQQTAPEEKKSGKEKVVVYRDFRDGAIALVIAPTRELCNQIFKEINRCCKLVDLNAVACYGGAGIGSQLGAIKRGVEVIVGTPGRLIDILTMNGGRLTSLKRVTFIVLDEADRMFDFGFEPQVTSIIASSRPDRQTCLFSATFPPHIEALARRILQKPVEIIVGEKGRTAANVQQYVEVMEEERKFFRLLQLLGEWQEHGSVIIFVNRQVEADELFTELLKYGYQAATLHGGQDQTDREFTIQEFQDGVRTLLIATSVAARGLDCKHCVLVINMTCPNHIEDYVHRIGRTGRAGRIGVAYTFLTKEDADKADDLEKALTQSGQAVPQALSDLSAQYKQECNLGMHEKKKKGGGGFGGRGFSFSASEKSRQQRERQQAKKELGLEKDAEDEEFLDADLLAPEDVLGPSGDREPEGRGAAVDPVTGLPVNFSAATVLSSATDGNSLQSAVAAAAAKAASLAQRQAASSGPGLASSEGAERARVVAELLRRQDEERLLSAVPPPPPPGAPASPPPVGDATALSIPQQADRMAQNAVQHIADPIERARHFAAVKQSLTNFLTSRRAAANSASQAVATGFTPGQHQHQLAVAAAAATAAAAAAGAGGEVAEAATQALELLKSGSQSLSASMALQANLEKLRNMSSQTAQSVAAALAVLSPANATLGRIRGLSERGYKCPNTGNFVDEFEINDYPQIARYKFTQRDVLSRLMEETGAVLYVKGQHVDPKEKHKVKLAPGAKYLHVEIIGATPIIVQRARNECRQLLEALAVRSLNTTNTQTARAITGRYNIWS
ncbi:DEAD/DEAH box helicase domain-containing protein [Toxoplasma gondii ME49]|uniref:RNA helicase n=2 Tax=Toxoplasma gondii TaxID=5811 RepID=S8GJH3_TOXGM|nr:DEAD/DEAH box helicase domain-containing protein [Toxoplasma gondii ME49]EPT32005.1 DEAD/DEAH box helicase domain-containing protein [Toxoplasma gondii ME49]KYF42661.1 DEAD/DEAH box helicase domain-containing protein [Toxoplasma gondii ARI]|eukprot:XP_018638281.1 DEAD/DEAH box helicase domain-containing protein [Toxoplasma gondii ME49]